MARSYHFLSAGNSPLNDPLICVASDNDQRRKLKARGWERISYHRVKTVLFSLRPFADMPRADRETALRSILGHRYCSAFNASRFLIDGRERDATARELTRLEWYWNRIDEKACAQALTSAGAVPSK